MKKLDKRATNIEIDLESGFVYATDDSVLSLENFFQAFLVEENGVFVEKIDSRNSGYDEGMCRDYNSSIGVCNEDCFDEFLELCEAWGIEVI